MKSRVILLAALVASISLAGCTSGAGTDGEEAGTTGGISGLLVDDNFRPIHLTDSPNGEFAAQGFILVKPTGDILQTTVNGEFLTEGLAPGAYELHVQAEGYEAAPMTVEVAAGEISEATVEARRILNEGGQILTQEYAIFIDCWHATPAVLHTEANCFADLSRDSKRGGMRADYSHIDNVTYLIAEFLMSEPNNYRTLVGYGEGEAVEEEYAMKEVEGDYSRLLLSTDEAAVLADEEAETGQFDGFLNNSQDWIAVVFPLGEKIPVYNSEDVPQVTIEDPTGTTSPRTTPQPRDTAGAGVGTRAQVVTTIFIGEPQLPQGTTLQDYCAICS